ncbi:hypothetical protein N0V82_007700 [Gnomoniopsis sp. IMI 355080]|nr:hypothetical protein N0V82_007700 [Gnomoniopsis sp. IMI 355080]
MEPSNTGEAPPVDIHAPFTRAERMAQLAEIDQDIVSLLALSGNALKSLGRQPQPTGENEEAPKTTDEQTQTFQDTMDNFLTTLHKVDVRMKRQIFGLEEAGILTLDKTKPKDDEGVDPAQKPTIEPNGMGLVGNLDVGWLNSRSNQVELEKEAELWTSARKALENVSRGTGTAGQVGDGDIDMAENADF